MNNLSETENEQMLLMLVLKQVKKNPKFFSQVVIASQQGLVESISDARCRAADFETAVSSLLEHRKGGKMAKHWWSVAADKIWRHEGNTSNNWPYYLKYFPKKPVKAQTTFFEGN